jgi:hypothetical protein
MNYSKVDTLDSCIKIYHRTEQSWFGKITQGSFCISLLLLKPVAYVFYPELYLRLQQLRSKKLVRANLESGLVVGSKIADDCF